MCAIPKEIMTVDIKTMKMHCVLNGIHERVVPKKRFQQAHDLCKCAHEARGKVARRGKKLIEQKDGPKTKVRLAGGRDNNTQSGAKWIP